MSRLQFAETRESLLDGQVTYLLDRIALLRLQVRRQAGELHELSQHAGDWITCDDARCRTTRELLSALRKQKPSLIPEDIVDLTVVATSLIQPAVHDAAI